MDAVNRWAFDSPLGVRRAPVSPPRIAETARQATVAPFIAVDGEGKLSVCPESARMLADVHHSITIVAIGGSYRAGKDFLVNRLAGVKDAGIAVDPNALRQTKGIWAWLKPHPLMSGDSLLVLDLDLLDDTDKVEVEVDNYLTVMAMLLCCEFVWSTTASPLGDDLDYLRFLSKLSDYVTLPSRPLSPRGADSRGRGGTDVFPAFSLCLWDRGAPRSAADSNRLLERALRERASDTTIRGMDFDMRRDMLSAHFSDHLCFGFPLPSPAAADLGRIPDARLGPALRESALAFTQSALRDTGLKCMQGARLDGALLLLVAEHMCESQRAAAPLCVHDAMTRAAWTHNVALCRRSAHLYRGIMAPALERLPLLAADSRHERALLEAQRAYDARCVLDSGSEHTDALAELISAARREIFQEDDEQSGRRCRDRLRELYTDVSNSLNEECFTRPGGHALYSRLMDELKQLYIATPDLGTEKDHVLMLFLKEKREEDRIVFIVDKIVTFMEKDRQKSEDEKKQMMEKLTALEEQSQDQNNLISSLRHKIENLEQYAIETGWNCPEELPKRSRDSCTIL